MFTIDDKIRGIPAAREQVVSLHQSINFPNLAVPGKIAGPAQAFVVGLRGPSGFAVFVYLALAGGADCAVYVPERRNLASDEYQQGEADAMAFVESMGFMMDNMNFRGLRGEDQDQLLRTLPVFQKDPRAVRAPGAGKKVEDKPAATVALGRLFASF